MDDVRLIMSEALCDGCSIVSGTVHVPPAHISHVPVWLPTTCFDAVQRGVKALESLCRPMSRLFPCAYLLFLVNDTSLDTCVGYVVTGHPNGHVCV